jgi:hypothetical protein
MHQESPATVFTGAPARSSTHPGRSRIFARALGVTLAVLLVLPIAQSTQPAEAGKKFKTITRTFSSNEPIVIEDIDSWGHANPYPTTIDVDVFKKKAKIADVNLTLHDFGHQHSEDVDVMLTFGDRQVEVMSDAGNWVGVLKMPITLDDEAAEDLPKGDPLTGGTYRPRDYESQDTFSAPLLKPYGAKSLSEFDGLNPNGEWRLFIMDDTIGGLGAVNGGWELQITAKVKTKKHKK